MSKNKRKFKRDSANRPYRRIFVLAVEGHKTERSYFSIFADQSNPVLKILTHKYQNSPSHVLERMEKHLEEQKLKNSDEAWLVIDKDQWKEEHLSELYTWSRGKPNYGFALSNPKFEFWLLLHFEEGNDVNDSRTCSEKLKRHLPTYEKNTIDKKKFPSERINDAIERAKARDRPPCSDWPRETGTTVYKLVENILKGNP